MKKKTKKNVKIRRLHLSSRELSCPYCGTKSKRHSTGERTFRDVGKTTFVHLVVIYSKHYCKQCERYFSQPMDNLGPPRSRFTHAVIDKAVDLVLSHGMTLDNASLQMLLKHHVRVPATTLHDWLSTTIPI